MVIEREAEHKPIGIDTYADEVKAWGVDTGVLDPFQRRTFYENVHEYAGNIREVFALLELMRVPYLLIGSPAIPALDPSKAVTTGFAERFLRARGIIQHDVDILVPRDKVHFVYSMFNRFGPKALPIDLWGAAFIISWNSEDNSVSLGHRKLSIELLPEFLSPVSGKILGTEVQVLNPAAQLLLIGVIGPVVRVRDTLKIRALMELVMEQEKMKDFYYRFYPYIKLFFEYRRRTSLKINLLQTLEDIFGGNPLYLHLLDKFPRYVYDHLKRSIFHHFVSV